MTRLENPEFNEMRVTSTGLAYAKNGTTVTYVFGEEWDEGQPIGYNITYAREFRYDTGRARYLNRELDPDDFENGTMTEVSSATTIWTDYDGDQPYGDFTAVPGSPTSTITEQRSFELGVATFDWSGGSPDEVSVKFYHSDMIGTTRMMTDSTGFEVPFSAVYTAFGERIGGLANRYGYAGGWGYQTDDTGDFPFQHVGARYYDPSTGRFLQRDPIGIGAGFNVYAYVRNQPTVGIDPSGLFVHASIASGFITITGGSGTTFLDRLGDRLAGRNAPAGPASGLGSAVNSRRRKGSRLPGQRRGTNRLARRLTRRGLGRAANAVRRFAPICAAIGGIIDTGIIVREIPFAYYDIPPGQY